MTGEHTPLSERETYEREAFARSQGLRDEIASLRVERDNLSRMLHDCQELVAELRRESK